MRCVRVTSRRCAGQAADGRMSWRWREVAEVDLWIMENVRVKETLEVIFGSAASIVVLVFGGHAALGRAPFSGSAKARSIYGEPEWMLQWLCRRGWVRERRDT